MVEQCLTNQNIGLKKLIKNYLISYIIFNKIIIELQKDYGSPKVSTSLYTINIRGYCLSLSLSFANREYIVFHFGLKALAFNTQLFLDYVPEYLVSHENTFSNHRGMAKSSSEICWPMTVIRIGSPEQQNNSI